MGDWATGTPLKQAAIRNTESSALCVFLEESAIGFSSQAFSDAFFNILLEN